jgi:hypothetical protein
MAEQQVVISGKSHAEVAHQMALELLTKLEGKTLTEISRKDYLKAHYDCVMVLAGNSPD